MNTGFDELCMACRTGDVEKADNLLANGVNPNQVDEFDYTPLYLSSLCGHEEVVKLLLQRGAVCDADKHEGIRCIYGALTDSIRNLLIEFDISKVVDASLPFASHIRILLKDDKMPVVTEDVVFKVGGDLLRLHKFMLSSRVVHFRDKFLNEWKDQSVISFKQEDEEAVKMIVDFIYLTQDLNKLDSIDHDYLLNFARKVELTSYADGLESYYNTVSRKDKVKLMNGIQRNLFKEAREDFEKFVHKNIIKEKIVLSEKITNEQIESLQQSGGFPDIILSVDLTEEEDDEDKDKDSGKTVYYPVHRAILIRNDYFRVMFTSSFQEAQEYEIDENLNIVDLTDHKIPVINLPFENEQVTEMILKFLYYDHSVIPLEYALDVLFAGNLLLNDRLKTMAAVAITTTSHTTFSKEELYATLRAGWETRTERLDHFVAEKIADNLELFITDPSFKDIVVESSNRIKDRQETDTIELIDDIRFYLAKKWKVDFDGLFEGEVNDYYQTFPGYESYSEEIQTIDDLLSNLNLEA